MSIEGKTTQHGQNWGRSVTPNFMAGLVLGLLNIATALSIAALIFSGPLSSELSAGVGIFLISTLFSALSLPLFSDYKANIGGPRSAQAPIFAAMGVSIVSAMSGADAKTIAITVMITILISTLATGILMYGVGRAKLGGLVRYIPYPVMGGFFAGLGYLLIIGGLNVGLGGHSEETLLDYMTSKKTLTLLLPVVIVGILLYGLDKKLKHWSVVPLTMLAAGGVFYGVLFLTDTTMSEATLHHWLPPTPSATATFFPPLVPSDFALVNWTAITQQAGAIAVLVFLSIIMLLLDVSGIEVVLNKDMDPNRELVAAGKTNVIGSFVGSPLTFQSVSDVLVSHKLGGTNHIMVVAYSLIVFAAIAVGPSLITWIPNFVLGSVLLFSGGGLLIVWVWDLRKKVALGDYLVVLVILAVMINFGILEGIAVGVVMAIFLFVHQYSRLSIVRSQLKADEFSSSVDRHPQEQAFLDSQRGVCEIFILQGFLFFGSASRFVDEVKALLKSSDQENLRYVLIDFRAVDALDTSAANSFSKLAQLCTNADLTLILTGCSYKITKQLQNLEDIKIAGNRVVFFDDINSGIEWMDDQRLETFEGNNLGGTADIAALTLSILGDELTSKLILDYGEIVELEESKMLFEQGDPGDALYFLLKGALNISIDLGDGDSLSVRTMRAGAVVGEMALFTGAARSATALAKEECTLCKLSVQTYQNLQKQHPAQAGIFHTYIIQLMSDRLSRANREVVALSR
ncbi:MAG: SulP family inorganic anion transporter [Hyphomicrobiales bacterium]